MAAATLTGTQAAASYPVGGSGGAFDVKASVGTVTVDASSEDGDIFQVCKVPAGATVIGGWIQAGDGDTGIEALDIMLGWAATADEVADPNGLFAGGTWTGDVSVHLLAVGNYFPLAGVLQSAGPKYFSAEATIQLETNTAAATGVAMEVTVVVLYLFNRPAAAPAAPV